MRLCALASGSSGNATFLSTPSTRILIDAGLSVKSLTARMAEIGERPESLDAILISHEHSDHISGLARLVRHLLKRARPTEVYLTERTAAMIDWDGVEMPPVRLFKPGASFAIRDIGVSSFTIPHDAVDPLGFCFTAAGIKIGIATDLGYVPDAMRARFRGCQALLIESNHDLDMLRAGPHPAYVKERVASDTGHLSNLAVADFIRRDFDSSVRHLMLGHVSQENNDPAMLRAEALEAIYLRGLNPRLTVVEQGACAGELIEL